MTWLIDAGARLLAAAVLAFLGLRLIRAVRNGAGRSMERAGMEISLRKFLDALLYALLLGLLIFAAAEVLGLNITSMVAVVGSIGLAISLAMQNTLGNFAGGVIILALKPFKVGDYVSTVDGEGTVETIGLVYTSLVTTDNRVLVIPNNTLANSPLTNLTGMEKRRLIINVLIDYESDLERAKELLTKLLRENSLILKEEDILAVVDSLGEGGVSLSARGWTRTEDYWQARWDMMEKIKLVFDQEGIRISHFERNVPILLDSEQTRRQS